MMTVLFIHRFFMYDDGNDGDYDFIQMDILFGGFSINPTMGRFGKPSIEMMDELPDLHCPLNGNVTSHASVECMNALVSS